jgi:hypothetical protein
MAGEGFLDLFIRGILVVFQKDFCRHDHPWGTKSALDRPIIYKGLLNRGQLTALRKAFDGEDITSIGLKGQHQTSIDGFAVDQNGARAAMAFGTTLFCTRQVQLISKDLE